MSLRATLVLFLLAVSAYALGIAGYLGYRVGPAADAMRRTNEPALVLFGELTARTGAIRAAVADAHHVADASGAERTRLTRRVRDQLGRIRDAGSVQSFGAAPSHLLGTLARAHDGVTRLENSLHEMVALVELGRLAEARAAEPALDSLETQIATAIAAAQRLGVEDLIARERQFGEATRSAVRGVMWWIAAGLVLIPVAGFVTRQRVAVPLARLQAGLNMIAEGNLNAEVKADRDDEMGKLAGHFNAMTKLIRERAEEQGRFAATGELLAGVAHEVNNPLMAITALAENQLDDPSLPEQRRDDLTLIARHAKRAGRLVSGLLRFVRPHDGRVRAFIPHAVVEQSVSLVAFRLPVDEITLSVDVPDHLGYALGSAARLEQVLVNLLSNAIEEVRQAERPRKVTVRGWTEQAKIRIEVADTGRGIAPEIGDRLFRPFVTSKGKKGNGLGLYMSREIMREMGGDLELRAGSGTGARFVVTLKPAPANAIPQISGQFSGEIPRPKLEGPGLEGLRILLADDEDALRAPLSRYLKRQGAIVLEARDGVEALAQANSQPLDVVVADLRMPRMGGLELYQRLCKSLPDLSGKVLFLSGDLGDLAEEAPEISPDRLLLKPIQLADLGTRIAALAAGVPPPKG